MERTTDGFRIAEEDFKIRGSGNIFGTEQSGLPPLRFASLETDYELLTLARNDASRLVKEDPTLAPWPGLREKMQSGGKSRRLAGDRLVVAPRKAVAGPITSQPPLCSCISLCSLRSFVANGLI